MTDDRQKLTGEHEDARIFPQITAEALIAAGYKEFPSPPSGSYRRLFQKRVTDADGTLYILDFREWHRMPDVAYDAAMCCDTASGGYLWATFREDSIRATEIRAGLLWAAAGCVRYD
jgi:hypothetical protein